MNKESNQDNPGVKIPPPLVFNGLALSGVFLHYFIPFSMVVGSWAVILGVLLLLCSFFLFWIHDSVFQKPSNRDSTEQVNI
jgi:hypothetical protein